MRKIILGVLSQFLFENRITKNDESDYKTSFAPKRKLIIRKVKQYIDEIVMLAANIVYGNKDKGTEEQLEQIQSIKNFMTLNPDF